MEIFKILLYNHHSLKPGNIPVKLLKGTGVYGGWNILCKNALQQLHHQQITRLNFSARKERTIQQLQ